ncbi:hypothetical protein SH611_22395 [Geminicoccaceae bacterium 1502E]|nr:hypothetical protein [Geminicoccaceae bacterium 1502E]
MSDHLAAAYGILPVGHLVDGGYTRLGNIASLAEADVAAYAPGAGTARRDQRTPRAAP